MTCNKEFQDIKQATTPLVKVPHSIDLSLVKRVDFIFKSERSETAKALVLKSYPGEVIENEGVFYIPLTYQQARSFPSASTIYLDPRIVYKTGESKRIGIMQIWIDDTLWSMQDVINADEGGGVPGDYRFVVMDPNDYWALPEEERKANKYTIYFLRG